MTAVVGPEKNAATGRPSLTDSEVPNPFKGLNIDPLEPSRVCLLTLFKFIYPLIDSHDHCIDRDIIERKAFFMEIICKLWYCSLLKNTT